jgi:hypothetical protein
MWIKKINEFFDNMSEYDNSSLSLHFAVDLIDVLKDRVTFSLDDDCNVSINILPYDDLKEETEVDEEGFLYWLQFTFHKELIDIILSLKNKFESIQDNLKKLVNDIKVEADEMKQNSINEEIGKNEKELDALKMILSRVDTYRRNTFNFLRDKESIEKIITHIRIYKEQSE